MKQDHVLAVFNRGKVSRRVLSRIDVDRIALSAETMVNWMPRTLGPMSLRPGFGFLGQNPDDGAYVPFVFDNLDNALLEMTPNQMRVWDMGDTLVTRNTVAAAVTNGDFAIDLTGWTDADEGAVAASTWNAGRLQLVGTGAESAIRRQAITIDAGETGTAHSLRIVVTRGNCLFRVGTTAGDDDVFRQAVLRTGTHSISFTPGATEVWIEFSTTLDYPVLIESCNFESAGTLTLPTIYDTADACRLIRWDQSSDVVYLAAEGFRQQRIERRPGNSWSVVDYTSSDGPFTTENVDNITLTPDGLTGEVVITASQPLFQSGHVGSTWSISSQGQLVTANLSTAGSFSDPVFVTGTDTGRVVDITIAGTWTGTLTLQRSVGDVGNWVDVKDYTVNQTDAFDDGFDNSDIFYRVGFKAGGPLPTGTAEITLDFPNGSITGTVRITEVDTSQQVDAIVLTPLGGTDPTSIWAEGAWSDVQGYPSATALYQGRLWWAGNGRAYASVSDAFTSFDPDEEGDAGPINRTVGDGAVNQVNWLLPLERLMAGTDTREQSIRSNSFDEPITPTNYNSKATSTKGSAKVPASVSNSIGFFVGKNTSDVYELRWRNEEYAYRPVKATLLVPDIAEVGIVRIAHQEEPDVRLHCVKADGTACVMVRDEVEDVLAWVDVTTDGFIEDVCVLPGTIEDRVFYRVRRTVNGQTVRYHEEWAREDQCRGGSVNRQADSYLALTSGAATTDWSGLDHLEGKTVVAWGDGKDLGTYTVTAGAITVSEAVQNIVIGLGYTADYLSSKLAIRTQTGLDIMRRKRIDQMGLMLSDTHYQGLKYGSDFDHLDDLPLLEDEIETPSNTVWEAYDQDTFEFNGEWDTDSRLALRAAAPRPCTVMAALLSIDRQTQ